MSLTAQKTIVSHYNTPVLSRKKRIMGVCFVNDTVFLVRSHSSTIESYHDGVFTGSLTVPLRTGWISGIAASAAHNCLSVCRSQPVHTTAPCGFGICHPHGVVYAKMASVTVSDPVGANHSIMCRQGSGSHHVANGWQIYHINTTV